MTGKGFCKSTKDAFYLIMRNTLRFGTIHGLGAIFVYIGRIFITFIASLIGYFILVNSPYFQERLYSPVIMTLVSWEYCSDCWLICIVLCVNIIDCWDYLHERIWCGCRHYNTLLCYGRWTAHRRSKTCSWASATACEQKCKAEAIIRAGIEVEISSGLWYKFYLWYILGWCYELIYVAIGWTGRVPLTLWNI